MSAKRAIIFWGGWDGHEPQPVGQFLGEILTGSGFEVDIYDKLSILAEKGDSLLEYDLIVPVWTMGEIKPEEFNPVLKAVEAGVGIGGCHGGMCDSFRNCCEWQWMTGGQWVAHPGNDGVHYEVELKVADHEITRGMSNFWVDSEQYLMHTDPSNHVLATTKFPVADGPHALNGSFDMPVIWTRRHGQGNVFYCSLGHHLDVLQRTPVDEIMKRGLLWALR